MADNKTKTAVETTASNGATTSGQSAIDRAKAAVGTTYGVIVGKNPDGTNKTETLVDWKKRWFAMPEAERQRYVNQWAQAGIRTDVINGVNIWAEYGSKSIQLSQYGGTFTPQQLWTQDISSKQGSAGGTVAFTAQDAKTLVQSAYQSLLGRDATGDEYNKALALAMGQSSSTGSGGRQQSVIDFIKGTQEYDAKMENKYLDAMYNAVANKARAAQA